MLIFTQLEALLIKRTSPPITDWKIVNAYQYRVVKESSLHDGPMVTDPVIERKLEVLSPNLLNWETVTDRLAIHSDEERSDVVGGRRVKVRVFAQSKRPKGQWEEVSGHTPGNAA